VSAKGFMYGYAGSVILLVFNLSMVMKPDLYGIVDSSLPPRIAFLTVGIWWMGFAQYTFKYLPTTIKGERSGINHIFQGFKELLKTMKELRDQPVMLNFLTAFFLYSVGVQSIILLATIYGKTEIGLETSSLIMTIIIIQLVGILGAYVFSKMSDKIGNILTLKITIIIWALSSLSAYYLEKEDPNVQLKFYIISGFIGLVLGAIQSLSRSTFSKLLPQGTEDNATYFSFFGFIEKIAIVWGTFIFGFTIAITNSMRNSILLLTLFFFLSFIVLSFMKKTNYVK
jgi:UMF1 family MFS transporter